METGSYNRKGSRVGHAVSEDEQHIKKNEKIKMKGNSCTRFTKLCWIITVLCIVIWVVLFKVNTLMGNGLMIKTVIEDGKVTEVIVDDPKKDVINILFCGTDESGDRTDTIMYIKYDTVHDKMYMMSIPRDTYIPDLKNGYLRINSVYNGGDYVDELVEEVNELLGVTMDYYVVIDIPTIWSVVDILGGLEITLEEDVWKLDKYASPWSDADKKYLQEEYGAWEYDMNNAGLWYPFLRAGTQTLNSAQVEKLVRSRDYADGDMTRGKTQRQVMMALIENFKKPTNYVKIPAIISKVFSSLDTNATVREVMKYIDEIKDFDASNVVSENMPTLEIGYYVNGNSLTRVDEEKAQSIIKGWVYVEPVIVTNEVTGEVQ